MLYGGVTKFTTVYKKGKGRLLQAFNGETPWHS